MAKILVIDDEPEIRHHLQKILKYEGFETIIAENGSMGIQLALRSRPDLILCDVMMPGISGVYVLSTLRSDPATATIPFIFLTAKSAWGNIREGMGLGADDYVTKPFTTEELLVAIHTRLEKHTVIKQQRDALHVNLNEHLPQELLTPLTGIESMAEFLTNVDMLPEPVAIAQMGTIIHDSSLSLQRLVENYLLYADLRMSEHYPQQIQDWQQVEVVKTEEFISFLAMYKASEVGREQDLLLNLVEIQCRMASKSLQKIVLELLDNAFKFSMPGTPVCLVTSCEDSQFILQIKDYGPGLTRQEIANIGAFIQFKHDWNKVQGAGLGLTISRMLAQAHEGTLNIECDPEEGTTVTVMFKIHSTH